VILLEKIRDSANTLLLIQDRALNDTDHLARADAIICLARNYSNDPDTYSLLQQYAQIDANVWVRSVAKNLIKELQAKLDMFPE
jgi:hypothetical protein